MIWSNDIGDYVFYLTRLKWVLLVVVMCGVLNLVLLNCGSSNNRPTRFTGIIPWLCIVAGALAVVATNAREDWLLTLLGSEDDATAERAYYAYAKKVRPAKLISRIKSNREDDNVRYYLCRMLGDVLRNAPSQCRGALPSITNAPSLTPRFIAQTRVNKDAAGFATPIDVQMLVTYFASHTAVP